MNFIERVKNKLLDKVEEEIEIINIEDRSVQEKILITTKKSEEMNIVLNNINEKLNELNKNKLTRKKKEVFTNLETILTYTKMAKENPDYEFDIKKLEHILDELEEASIKSRQEGEKEKIELVKRMEKFCQKEKIKPLSANGLYSIMEKRDADLYKEVEEFGKKYDRINKTFTNNIKY